MNRINLTGKSEEPSENLNFSPQAKKLILLIINELANNVNMTKLLSKEETLKFLQGFAERVHTVAVREVATWDDDFKNRYIAGAFEDQIRKMIFPYLMACLVGGQSIAGFIELVRDEVAKQFAVEQKTKT